MEKTISWFVTKAIRYANAEHTKIDCVVQFKHILDGPCDFTADKDDCEAHGRDIFNELETGKYGKIAGYTPSPPPFVSAIKLRFTLNKIGLRSSFEECLAGASQDIKDTWEFSDAIPRNSDLVLFIQNKLKKSNKDIDDLFILAVTP